MPRPIEYNDVPTREECKSLTVRIMRSGVRNSFRMRELIAAERDLEVSWATDGHWSDTPSSAFINTHAFALVELQNEGLIEKIADKEYQLRP